MSDAVAPPDVMRPFPGLRAFSSDEAHLFFGRDGQRNRLVELLRANRFVAVVGTSGCGKSSLVQAGLLPALDAGAMNPRETRWQVADFRPRDDPFRRLAEALAPILARHDADAEAAWLRTGSSALVQAVDDARARGVLAPNENLLVLVDQFEELFRYHIPDRTAARDRDEKAEFVALLLRAASQPDARIYVALTLRSDFLGDCAQFRDLPERINASQYLVPRMTRDQRQAAIEGPIHVAGASITAPLVRTLLNDLGDDPDQLPVLQHALMRTWDVWVARDEPDRPIDVADYDAVGALDSALGAHADEVANDATRAVGDDGTLVKRIFQRLRVVDPQGRETRSPASVRELAEAANASADAVRLVVDRFRDDARGSTFVTPFASAQPVLDDATQIDVTHESLLRRWPRLADVWVKEEEEWRRRYTRLVTLAEADQDRPPRLLRGAQLESLAAWWDQRQPSATWAARYHPDFEAARDYLAASREADAEETRREAEAAREAVQAAQREAAWRAETARVEVEREKAMLALANENIASRERVNRWQRYFAITFGVLLVVIGALFVRAQQASSRAQAASAASASAASALRQELAHSRALQDTMARQLAALRQTTTERDSIRQLLLLRSRSDSSRQLSADEVARAQQAQRTRDSSAARARIPAQYGLKLWVDGATLRVHFLGGTPALQAKVLRYASEWTRSANLHFVASDRADAEIRIAFDAPGESWAYLGTDALGIPAGQPTMQLGAIAGSAATADATSEADVRRTVLHEFGHVLGLIHEIANPNASIPWDTAAVYRLYREWDAATVRAQVLARDTGVVYRAFDPQSVMMVPIPAELTAGRLTVGVNDSLSASDRTFAAKLYPGATTPDSARPATATAQTEGSGLFGSTILDVAIGLVLVFLMLSLVASAIREAIESVLKARAVHLERGIREMLADRKGEGLARIFYEHPVITSLFPNPFVPAEKRYHGRNLPTYIPARNFATALIDMALRGPNVGPYAAQQTTPALSVAALRASVQRIPSVQVQHALLVAIDGAQGDLARVQRNVEKWYDSTMDRVSGGYKRRTQLWLFAIGLVTTVALNVNTITIADYLGHDKDARAALVGHAQQVLRDTNYLSLVRDTTLDSASAARARAVYADLQALDLPIGWDRQPPAPPPGSQRRVVASYWIRQIFGLLLTAFAVTLGAPFWFDTLNRIMVIRSTVKPHEKSPEEASEDRQPKGKGARKDTSDDTSDDDDAPSPRPQQRDATTPPQDTDAPQAPPGQETTTAVETEAPFTPQQWANDVKEEGIL